MAALAAPGALAENDGGPTAEPDARRQLAQAESWHRQGRSVASWLLYRAIPPETEAGAEARRRLQAADLRYQACLDALHTGDGERARREFLAGRALAPIDPHHYYELGEIYHAHGFVDRRNEAYGIYLGFMNQAGEPVDPGTLQGILANLRGDVERVPNVERQRPGWGAVAAATAATAFAVIALVAGLYLRRGKPLAELIDENPDLHPRIAYAIGCLRHELLKHRLGALGDAVYALRGSDGLTSEQVVFLRDRLYGGESLTGLWFIYLETFDRLAGRRLHLARRDREFRRATQAVRAIEALRGRFEDPDEQVAERLDALRGQVLAFDRHLRWLADHLCRAKVDGQLLREALFSVQSEPRAAAVRLDEIRFEEPPPDVFVEVFRADLLLVLKNLVRNAILALGRQDELRRVVGLEVEVRTEPTGDESVLIEVLDTSPEALTMDDIYGRRLDRGLGLVAAAVTRYDGSLFVGPARGEYRKAVVVRFFRALGEGE